MAEWTLRGKLQLMADRGSSVTLNWGEDTNAWECSWITGGKRFSASEERMEDAVNLVLAQVKISLDRCQERDNEYYGRLVDAIRSRD